MVSAPIDMLAFSPHPDDVELHCSGSLLLAVKQGLRAAVVDLSAGEMSSRGTAQERERERQNAGTILGLDERVCLGLPDSRIGEDPRHREPVIEAIQRLRPSIVLAPYWIDRHPDHEAAGRLVKQACYFSGLKRLNEGAPHRPRRIYYYCAQNALTPSFVVDVSSVWEQKIAAIKAYSSQFDDSADGFPTAISRPDFLRFIEARAIWFGGMIGAAYGEGFVLPGPVPLDGIPVVGPELRNPGDLPPYSLN